MEDCALKFVGVFMEGKIKEPDDAQMGIVIFYWAYIGTFLA